LLYPVIWWNKKDNLVFVQNAPPLQGEVRLQMRVDSAAYKWDCSGNIPDIAEASDGCRYVP